MGWERKPQTDAITNGGVIIYGLNQTIDSGVLLTALRRERIADLMTLAQSRRVAVVNAWTSVGNYGAQAATLAVLSEAVTGL